MLIRVLITISWQAIFIFQRKGPTGTLLNQFYKIKTLDLSMKSHSTIILPIDMIL